MPPRDLPCYRVFGMRREVTPAADLRFVSMDYRISAGNCELFHARQWVREQGGDLHIEAIGETATVCGPQVRP
jgi:hypothetical protein